MALSRTIGLAWEADAEHRAIVSRAEQLPGARADLLQTARGAVGRLHDAALAGDAAGVAAAVQTYEAVVWWLNGNMFFARRDCCHLGEADNVAARRCASQPAQNPLRGT